MRYVSALSDPAVKSELLADLSGLSVGSAFLLHAPEQAERLLQLCDAAAKHAYDENTRLGRPAEVECITIDAGGVIGFDSVRLTSELGDEAVIVPVYRYFDTPREAIVAAAISAPSEIRKTRELTFFCGPDRRKTGDYRIFSLHPGPKRQAFPSRYQAEAVRRANQDYWDRRAFMATPNQIIAAKQHMRAGFKDLEQEAKDRVFHMTRQMESALHRWYGTYEQTQRPDDIRNLLKGELGIGDYSMAQDGTVYYYMTTPGQPPPDPADTENLLARLSNRMRPAIIRADGSEEYFVEGKRHRDRGPAVYTPDQSGGWTEIWYEEGLISRLPEEGPAKVTYNAKGEVIGEVAVYKGAEVEATTLGEAVEPIKVLQALQKDVGMDFKWFEESADFALLRGQLGLAASRAQKTLPEVVRQMQGKDEQMGLRWDFDRTLEQDERVKENFGRMTQNLIKLEDALIAAAQAMRFVRGDPNIVNGIWGKIQRDLERLIERGHAIPSPEPGKTMVESLAQAKEESKKFFQSMAEQSRLFSGTGR